MSRDLHYCRACDRFNAAPTCPCGATGARISASFAERILWSINADRMRAWIAAGVVVPKTGSEVLTMKLGSRLENVNVDRDAYPVGVCVLRPWEKKCKRPGVHRVMRLGGHLVCPGCDQTCSMDHIFDGVADPDRLQVKVWNDER